MPHAGMKSLVAGLLASAAAASCALLPTASSDLSLETVGNRADLVSGGDVLVRALLPASADPSRRPAPHQRRRQRRAASGARRQGLCRPRHRPRRRQEHADPHQRRPHRQPHRHQPPQRRPRSSPARRSSRGPAATAQPAPSAIAPPPTHTATCRKPAASSRPTIPPNPPPTSPRPPRSKAPPSPTSSAPKASARTAPASPSPSWLDPAKPWTPYAPQPQWNGGVFVLQGAGCGTGFTEEPAGDPLNDRALKQGFAVVTVALLHNTINCNPVVQAEAAMMATEHVAETYGPFDFVFAQGSSGGAISAADGPEPLSRPL